MPKFGCVNEKNKSGTAGKPIKAHLILWNFDEQIKYNHEKLVFVFDFTRRLFLVYRTPHQRASTPQKCTAHLSSGRYLVGVICIRTLESILGGLRGARKPCMSFLFTKLLLTSQSNFKAIYISARVHFHQILQLRAASLEMVIVCLG